MDFFCAEENFSVVDMRTNREFLRGGCLDILIFRGQHVEMMKNYMPPKDSTSGYRKWMDRQREEPGVDGWEVRGDTQLVLKMGEKE